METFVVTATLGESGRFRGHAPGDAEHPGADALRGIREAELRAATAVLRVRELCVLGYRDQALDRADPREAIARLAAAIRRVQPHVVVTFAPDGAYGHPDYIAISQLTAAAIVASADPAFAEGQAAAFAPHAVAKLYYMVVTESAWAAYQAAVQEARLGRGRRGAPGGAVARVGGDDDHRHARRVGGCLARGLLP